MSPGQITAPAPGGPRRILLVRHGRPEVVRDYRRWAWIAGRDVAALLAVYDASGIDPALEPGDDVVARALGARRAFVSDLPRARGSAARLGLAERATEDAIFREAMPPTGLPGRWRLPAAVWLVVARILWMLNVRLPGESRVEALRRAREAAARLEEATREARTAVLVGHGWINWLIREELLRRGWSANAPYAREYWALNELTRSC